MKVIDLLNIWENDRSKLPEKIKIDDKIFVYNKQANLYKMLDTRYFLISNYLDCAEKLHKEIEVIEENKEIEELHILDEGDSNKALYEYCSKILIKQNELVRAVNKINKQLEEQETEDIDTVERELNKMF